MSLLLTESGSPLPLVEPPERLLKDFDRAFNAHPSKLNDFNTSLGFRLSELSESECFELSQAFNAQGLKFPTWKQEAGKELGLIEFIKINISVESHADDGYGRLKFFVWVLDSKSMPSNGSRFNGRALFRYFDLKGKKQEARLEPGMFIAFNQCRNHELLFMGEEVKLAVGLAPRL